MSKVIPKVVIDMTMSLDGYVSGPDGGDAGLHDWYFSPASGAEEFIAGLVETTGAMVTGRRTYEEGVANDGFVNNPFQVEHFVLCHEAPTTPAKGDTSFTFVTDGIESAVSQAVAAAGERNVIVGGGATVARLCLDAGLVDEIHLAVRPLVLGGGLSLFGGLTQPLKLEQISSRSTSSDVTLQAYRVVR